MLFFLKTATPRMKPPPLNEVIAGHVLLQTTGQIVCGIGAQGRSKAAANAEGEPASHGSERPGGAQCRGLLSLVKPVSA